MAERYSEDDGFSADMLLIDELVDELGLSRWRGDPDIILEVGDFEETRILSRRLDLFTFETRSRGRRSTAAVFSSARDARCYLITDLGSSLRFRTRMTPMVMEELAVGTELEDTPIGHRLSWPEGEATCYHRYMTVTFSWVVGADPATIVTSYRHPNGEPLFDLGVRAEPEVVKRPPRRIMDPPPIESPPREEVSAADQAAIDVVLTDLGWEPRSASGADVLAVGDAYMERAIAYRQAQFVYETVTGPDYRNTMGVFSTAAAARRFMLQELGGILRMRKRLPRILPNRLAPGCTIEKGPTAFTVAWPTGQATFPIGYIGHQRALDFSWLAMAELGEIAASYRHSNGEPLFDLSRPLQTPAE
jgi:hypothetical protein